MTLAARTRAETGQEQAGRRNQSGLGSRVAACWRNLAGRRLPAGLRASLALGKGERILTAAWDPADACVLVATERALYLRDGGDDWLRQGWERISAVDWDDAGRRLVLTGLADAGPGTRRSAVALGDRGCLVELASERIAHTRLGRWPLKLPDGEPATVEARRRPVTGEPLWLVHMDGTCWDISDRTMRDRTMHEGITMAIARLGADLGIPAQAPAGEGIDAL